MSDLRPPKSARMLPCPACSKATLFAPSNPWRPFCSERCRTSDLGAWASEAYRIPARPAEGGEEAGEEPSRE